MWEKEEKKNIRTDCPTSRCPSGTIRLFFFFLFFLSFPALQNDAPAEKYMHFACKYRFASLSRIRPLVTAPWSLYKQGIYLFVDPCGLRHIYSLCRPNGVRRVRLYLSFHCSSWFARSLAPARTRRCETRKKKKKKDGAES